MEFIAATKSQNIPEVSVFQDLGRRDDQQDRYVVLRLNTGLLLAVADGHGGHEASSMIAKYLSLIFSEEIEGAIQTDKGANLVGLPSSTLKRVIRKTIQRLVDLTQDMISGSTLTLAFVETGSIRPGSDPATRVTIGQLGDSIFAISSKPGRLSIAPIHSVRTQKKDIEEIKKRYQEKYGEDCKTSYAYIYSSPDKYDALALTRALGDSVFTLIRKPDVKTYVVDASQTVLLLTTDGAIKEGTSPRKAITEIINQIREGTHVSEISRKLQPLEDNTTIISVLL